ncbi:hypothetical protein [Bartonella schoenbuchensis]|uniref:hypothetical protein n=1 Tax=Bartonella schoenbuchensis TaxID=165694 RepID=UPI0031455465
MLSLSLSAFEEQQSPFLAFAWKGGFLLIPPSAMAPEFRNIFYENNDGALRVSIGELKDDEHSGDINLTAGQQQLERGMGNDDKSRQCPHLSWRCE